MKTYRASPKEEITVGRHPQSHTEMPLEMARNSWEQRIIPLMVVSIVAYV